MNLDSIVNSYFSGLNFIWNDNLIFRILIVLCIVFVVVFLFKCFILRILFYFIFGIIIYLCIFKRDVFNYYLSLISKKNTAVIVDKNIVNK